MKYAFLILSIQVLFSSCQQNKEAENPSGTKSKTQEKDTLLEKSKELQSHELQFLLDERKANFNAKASEEKKRIYGDGIQDIIDKQIVKNAAQVGDEAYNFDLPNATGENVKLSQLLDNGPVVLLWYRGGWCPYCNMTLSYYQDVLPEIEKAGGQLVAISPELPDSTLSTKEKNDLSCEILSDVGNQTAKDYGVVFELTPEVAEIYQESFDLHGYNGDESNTLPLAATFVIDTHGTIRYAFLDADYRNRAEPKEVIEVLKKL